MHGLANLLVLMRLVFVFSEIEQVFWLALWRVNDSQIDVPGLIDWVDSRIELHKHSQILEQTHAKVSRDGVKGFSALNHTTAFGL